MKLSELRKISQIFPNPDNKNDSAQFQSVLLDMGFDPGVFYQELEMESLYVDTHQDISYCNSNLQFHSHTFYEILCCRNTCNAEYLVGAERYKLQKGDIIFVPPGVSHRPLLPQNMSEPYIRDVLWVSEVFIGQLMAIAPTLLSDKLKKPFLFRTTGTHWEFLCDWFRDGINEAESGQPGSDGIVSANAVKLLIQLFRAERETAFISMEAEKPELLDRVLHYVENHLSEKITLADTARIFYVSESTITQTFRKKMGISFYRCVTQRRLIAAKKLIENGISMDSTAEKVGFSDYSTFFRAFKQEYGISPRQYRKMHNS